jgi:ferredoxin
VRHVITIANDGRHFECAAYQDVLRGMIQRGRSSIPVGCRGGGCGVCKVRVLAGRYRTATMSVACVSEQERAQGMALACKLFPETDLTIDVVGKVARALGFQFRSGVDAGPRQHQED